MLQGTVTDGEREETTYYFYGRGLAAQENVTGGYLSYHFNNVGSTMVVTDEEGNVRHSYQYSPYGELLEGEYSGEVSFLYNGQYGVVTDGNGLYYMRARYYNVDIKRFVNQDVLAGTLERIGSLNRYAYVEGNPVSFLDPFGLERIYVSETKDQHDFISNLAYILACVNISFPNPYTMVISIIISCYDMGLLIYDLSEYDPVSDEAIETWKNIGKDIISLIPGVGDYITIALYLKDKYDQGEL